jgi:uncharacterized membrane protein
MGVLLALVAIRILNAIDAHYGLVLNFDISNSITLLSALAGAMFTLIIFICSSFLIVVQLAGAQLTPRYLNIAFHHPVIRYSLSIFTFAFTFTMACLLRIKTSVPLLTGYFATYSCLLSLGFFYFLVDKMGRILRPSGALILVSEMGRGVIKRVFPREFSTGAATAVKEPTVNPGKPSAVIPSLRDGVVLAFDVDGLLALAERYDCIIELIPQVGNFISRTQPLFNLYSRKDLPSAEILYNHVAVGPERTLQQDPSFALRIIVDIASKGLSPAINDPTTAVLAVDQIQYLLRELGQRWLDEGLRYDKGGTLRLIYKTPDWVDFVSLAVTEIRQFGGTSIQIARRLNAMIESLVQILPEERKSILLTEQKLLQSSIARFFPEEEDRILALTSDLQGVGGKKS